ncbi:MAG: replication/maintenance protein RepL [Hydrogenophilaceae bacterium]|nr:replication/maintenance protein RepL [Hydrogenophilaceae bacterium]
MSRIEIRKVVDQHTGEVISENERRRETNRDFVQFYRKHIADIANLGRIDPLALAIWLWIVERMGSDNALVCSMTPLVEQFEKSRQTISKKISFLKRSRYLDIYKSGTTNVYVINAELVWTTNAERRTHAEFRASVVLSASEQPNGATAASASNDDDGGESKERRRPLIVKSRRMIT